MVRKVEADKEGDSVIAAGGSNTGELEVLRDLIFGNQARDFAQRLSDIDGRLETVRRELKSEQDSTAQSLVKTSSDQTTTLRKETQSRIDKEVQMLDERIDQLAADIREQMETARRALEARLERMQADASDRLRLLEEETRRRDDDLRSELLTMSAWLDDKKTSRHDLGRMMEDIGQRLQATTQPIAPESGDTE